MYIIRNRARQMTETVRSLPGFPEYVYHRTSLNGVEGILDGGYLIGSGAMYGRGWYFCYRLEDQFNGMDLYGDYLIRGVPSPEGVLIFDYRLARQVYGSGMGRFRRKAYTLVNQAVRWGIWPNLISMPQSFVDMSDILDEHGEIGDNSLTSSDVAYEMFVSGKDPYSVLRHNSVESSDPPYFSNGVPINSKIRGIMYNGRSDHRVFLSYYPDTVRITGYAKADQEVFDSSKEDGGLEWISLTDGETRRSMKTADSTDMVLDLMGGRIRKCVDEYGMSADEFKSRYSWFIDNHNNLNGGELMIIRSSKTGDPILIWKGGTWKGGTWKDGVLVDCSWQQGKFESGYFSSGTWEYGVFLGGVFGKHPEVADGMETAYWKEGIWKGGVWDDSHGTNVWMGGKIYDPKTHSYIESEDPPVNRT